MNHETIEASNAESQEIQGNQDGVSLTFTTGPCNDMPNAWDQVSTEGTDCDPWWLTHHRIQQLEDENRRLRQQVYLLEELQKMRDNASRHSMEKIAAVHRDHRSRWKQTTSRQNQRVAKLLQKAGNLLQSVPESLSDSNVCEPPSSDSEEDEPGTTAKTKILWTFDTALSVETTSEISTVDINVPFVSKQEESAV